MSALLQRSWPLLLATTGLFVVLYAGWARGGDAISWPFTVAGLVAYVAFLLLERSRRVPRPEVRRPSRRAVAHR